MLSCTATVSGTVVLAEVASFGRADLARDDRFRTRAGRVKYAVELVEACASLFAAVTTADALARLQDADVPSGPVLSPEEALVDPQVVHNAIVETHEHPVAGTTHLARPAARMSETPTAMRGPAPSFGEHTRAVLGELDLTSAEIDELFAAAVVR